MSTDIRLEVACQQIEFARAYTRSLIADVDDSEWFTVPEGAVTHVGWQVGHLAMAEYGLALFRLRGRKPEDAELMSSSFRKKFLKGSKPDPDPDKNPAPSEICEVLDQVHQQVVLELGGLSIVDLEEPVDEPYSVYPNKLGALLFCSAHEMMHAGQIGFLRRMLGKEPIR